MSSRKTRFLMENRDGTFAEGYEGSVPAHVSPGAVSEPSATPALDAFPPRCIPMGRACGWVSHDRELGGVLQLRAYAPHGVVAHSRPHRTRLPLPLAATLRLGVPMAHRVVPCLRLTTPPAPLRHALPQARTRGRRPPRLERRPTRMAGQLPRRRRIPVRRGWSGSSPGAGSQRKGTLRRNARARRRVGRRRRRMTAGG